VISIAGYGSHHQKWQKKRRENLLLSEITNRREISTAPSRQERSGCQVGSERLLGVFPKPESKGGYNHGLTLALESLVLVERRFKR